MVKFPFFTRFCCFELLLSLLHVCALKQTFNEQAYVLGLFVLQRWRFSLGEPLFKNYLDVDFDNLCVYHLD